MTLRNDDVIVTLLLKTQCLNQKQCSKWPPPALTHLERRRRQWCTEAAMTAWSSLAHSVLMRCLRPSRLVMHVLYTLSCSISHTLWSTGFKYGEFGGHSRGSMDSGVSLLAKTAFSMTSLLRHHYVVSSKYWWNILQLFSHRDCQGDSCQKLWKVV